MNTRIRELRNLLNVNQNDFAISINVSRSLICKIEKGERKLSEHIIDKICKTHGVNKEWLLAGRGEPLLEQNAEFTAFQEMVYKAIIEMNNEQKQSILKCLIQN